MSVALCAALGLGCERKAETPTSAPMPVEPSTTTEPMPAAAPAPVPAPAAVDTTGSTTGSMSAGATTTATGATTTTTPTAGAAEMNAGVHAKVKASGGIDTTDKNAPPEDQEAATISGGAAIGASAGASAGTSAGITTAGEVTGTAPKAKKTRKGKTTIVKEHKPAAGIGATGGPAGREDLRPEQPGPTAP